MGFLGLFFVYSVVTKIFFILNYLSKKNVKHKSSLKHTKQKESMVFYKINTNNPEEKIIENQKKKLKTKKTVMFFFII